MLGHLPAGVWWERHSLPSWRQPRPSAGREVRQVRQLVQGQRPELGLEVLAATSSTATVGPG